MLSLPESGSQLSTTLPPTLVSLTRLLLLSDSDFESARSKGKLPKGKLNEKDCKEVLEILEEVFKQREGMYTGGGVEVRCSFSQNLTLVYLHLHQDDERLLSLQGTLTERKRHAVIVRLGEKRILRGIREILQMVLAELRATSGAEYGNKKDSTRDKRGGNDRREAEGNRKRVVHGADGDCGRKKARK